MKTKVMNVSDGDKAYLSLAFMCPGCQELGGGIHMLPVNTTETSPAWTWDGNIDFPTLNPSILTTNEGVCHCFLQAGVFKFLDDCTHSFAGKEIPMPELPAWFT